MKTIILVALMTVASFGVLADGNARLCLQNSVMFRKIAEFRDDGHPPKRALDGIKHFAAIPQKSHKDAVNLVYFNKEFLYLSGAEIQASIFDTCMQQTTTFEPLK